MSCKENSKGGEVTHVMAARLGCQLNDSPRCNTSKLDANQRHSGQKTGPMQLLLPARIMLKFR